ncbi:MAG: TetR/AcrR family transcriptional regulator [Myxococcales bacterium]|nr:TetR/AcrR family transcriptional regulator [Myxococcales bacterium]
MPTKRFDAVDPERKEVVLRAAAAEFATHGFERASFNRIIERAGVSKGSMYYYFEDKADLYGTVVTHAVQQLIAACGPFVPGDDARSFWREVRRVTQAGFEQVRRDPHLAGLVRSLGRDGSTAAPVEELRTLSSAWFAGLLEAGQRLGAVRTDLPTDLMLSVAVGTVEGVELWLADRVADLDDTALNTLVHTITDLYGRMATPRPWESP